MGGVADGDFGCSLRYCCSSNTSPRTDGLMTSALQQIRYVVPVHLHVGAKQLRRRQAPSGGDAAAALERCEDCSAGTGGDARQRVHMMLGVVF